MNSIIVQHDSATILHEEVPAVPQDLFGTHELTQMITDMEEALDAEKDGVALAAPQISIPYRIFIVRYDRVFLEEEDSAKHPPQVGVYINPKIIKTSRRTEITDEGCLSVRGVYGKTKRHNRTTVRAQDTSGAFFVRGAGGLLAQAFQHEIDHLNGILFTDHAVDFYELQRDDATNTLHAKKYIS